MTRAVERRVRIGTGAGYSGSRVEPAIEIAERGAVNYLVFECLAERTIAIAQQQRHHDPAVGYDPYLNWRMPRVLDACLPRDIKIISNMGAANPVAAADRLASMVSTQGHRQVRIGVVTGDDVLDHVRTLQQPMARSGLAPADLGDRLIAANAYVGAEAIVEALDGGANIVVGGRFADPTLFLAPLVHEFDWGMTEWELLGAGTAVGHLLECSAQVTGGYFADPPLDSVPGLGSVGFPIADVAADGTAKVTKVTGSGGLVSTATCSLQLLYEIDDPSTYVTPDVVADFSRVELEQTDVDTVMVRGAGGGPRPDRLKVSVGYLDGYIGEGQISYGGPGAVERALLAADVLQERLEESGLRASDVRADLIGLNALYGGFGEKATPQEVRLRIAARCQSMADATEVGHEVEALYATGPAAGGGVTRSAREVLAIDDVFIPREAVEMQLEQIDV